MNGGYDRVKFTCVVCGKVAEDVWAGPNERIDLAARRAGPCSSRKCKGAVRDMRIDVVTLWKPKVAS